MAIGDYPIEYNPAKHGPYDPAKYYGKPDTPFGEVKIRDLGSWISRRNKNPSAIAGLFSRAFWRWQHKYIQPRRGGIAPFFHVAVGFSIIGYIMNYPRLRWHKNYKYH